MKTLRGLLPATLLFLAFAVPANAQSEAQREAQIRQLEQQLQQLTAQLDALRQQLDSLRGTPVEQDLTEVEPIQQTEPPTTPVTPPPPPETLDPQLVQNVSPAGASKVFNPDISAIGNFVVFTGENPFGEEPSATLEEAELAFQAFVDPYAKANFFIAVSEEGAEVEEGYINFFTLPRDFTAKVGKMKANFGKINLLHTHQRPWVDVPLVLDRFFGEEGLADSGVSLSVPIPNTFNVFAEATAEIFSGNAEGVFEAQEKTDLFLLGHFKVFRDLTENSNIEVGTSYARGELPEVGGTNQFGGVDLTFRYKPLQRAIYSSFIGRTEVLFNDRDDQSDSAFGFYTSADYQFSRRWFAGVRLDQADNPEDPSLTDQSASFTLTFWPSEFSQLRGQFRHINFDGAPDANEVLLQLNFSIGAHGAHTF